MNKLKIKKEGLTLYKAGLPKFPRNFTRDSIISAILAGDSNMLKDQLSFCATKQGKKKNPYTGEEPGKIFHEYPSVEIRGLSTKFNNCDCTALYLIGHEVYQKITNDKSLAKNHKKNIKNATSYILAHLKKGLFIESPKFCGAEKFALKVTYWKDSEIISRKDGEPEFPVTYTLAHIQNMAGLRSAARILNSKRLEKIVANMNKNLKKLYDHELGTFYIAVDRQGPIQGVSSDSLHALFYIRQEDLPKKYLHEITESSRVLETPIGYITIDPKLIREIESSKALNLESKRKISYHTKTVWPFEQAIIHIGARRFGLDRVAKVSLRIVQQLDTDSEIFIMDGAKFNKSGCDPQLWTIAAKKYFKSVSPKH